MSQFVKPIADKLVSGWVGNNVGGSNIYQEVDETVASTDDFTSYDVSSPTIANGADAPPLVWKVTSVTTPDSGTATVRLRTYANVTATYILEIRSGYVNEGNKGTLLGTSSTQSHPGDGAWHTLTDSAVTYAGGGDGTDLYFRVQAHNTSGSFGTLAVTAVDADLPNAPSGHNLSGAPDLLATTPLTSSGSGKNAWALSGSPTILAMTGTGSGYQFWNLTGSPIIFTMVGSGAGKTIVPIGKLVKVVVDGITLGGFSLEQFVDGTVLVAIGIVYDHGRWRWSREVIVAEADDIDLL